MSTSSPETPCSLPGGSIGDLNWFFEEKGKVELGKAQKEIEVWINSAPAATDHALILEDKPVIMAASKIDVANKEKLAKLKRYCKKKNLELFPISAVTGKGIDSLRAGHV